MITEDEIMEILRSKLYEEEMRGFYINKQIFSIDTCGIIFGRLWLLLSSRLLLWY